MEKRLNTISEKISLLNVTTLNSMFEESNEMVVKDFTDAGIKIFTADNESRKI